MKRAALLLMAWASTASAYTIETGFSEGCHEGITAVAYALASPELPHDQVPVPGGVWRRISKALIARAGLDIAGEREEFFFFSIFAGVRSPDTDGHSTLNLASIRAIHASPEGQYLHCLRAPGDDGVEGDAQAVRGCRAAILESMLSAREFLRLPTAEQIIEVNLTLDFYGTIQVDVWAPAYFLARALHTLQDSFTHSIRSPDLRQMWHVMNYAEAVGGSLSESRDGLAHSSTMDACDDTTEVLVLGAIEASADLLRAANRTLLGEDDAQLTAVLVKWINYEPGCSKANAYCDSVWVPLARKGATGPILEEALGCQQGPGSGGLAFGLLLLLGLSRRRLLLVLALFAGCAEDPLPASDLAVRVLYPVGSKGDRAFADSVFAGLTYGRWRLRITDVVEVEPQTLAETEVGWRDALKGPAKAAELLITVGLPYPDLIASADCDFGGRQVLHLDEPLSPCPGLRAVTYQTFEPSFVAGVAAMAVAPRRTAAVIGGMQIAPVDEFIDGFIAGVEYAGGRVTAVEYLADDFSGFNDPAKARAVAERLYADADVVFPVAGGSGIGVIEAAEAAEGRFTLGVDSDQTVRGVFVVIGSVVKRLDRTVSDALFEMERTGRLEPGVVEQPAGFIVNPGFEGVLADVLPEAIEAARRAAP
ncbi:MAG: basic membrane lipoprotein Med (substrate-binding protein (PBP1-ABC) superfamily) [Bradymonadia bacterium]|jgi:basic membrane lipoprotein Med (substrate-binding protein (PBP1-ABC) superfamily)